MSTTPKRSPTNTGDEVFSFERVKEIVDEIDGSKEEVIAGVVEYMNGFFAVIKGTTSTYIEKLVNEDGRVEYIHRTRAGFKDAMVNKVITLYTTKSTYVRGKKKEVTEEETVDLFDLWTKSPDRREYDRIVFRQEAGPTSFNIYEGLQVERDDLDEFDADDAKPWVEHIRKIWAREDAEVFEYIINYLAHLVQFPFKKTKVAFVLRSRQGAGKGIVLSKIGEIFGRHFKVLKPKEILGDFNEAVMDALVLFLDESVPSWDKKVAAELKLLITEDKQQVNRKHLPAITIENHMNVFIATNYKWCAPIEESDRRYFVIELDNKYAGKMTKKSKEYFDAIVRVPYQAVYKYLMERDLTDFDPRIYPVTSYIREQKIYTMDSVVGWIYHSLAEGEDWVHLQTATKKELHEWYKAYTKEKGGHWARCEPYSQFLDTVRSVLGLQDFDRLRFSIGTPEKMATSLRKYLDDPHFPVGDIAVTEEEEEEEETGEEGSDGQSTPSEGEVSGGEGEPEDADE